MAGHVRDSSKQRPPRKQDAVPQVRPGGPRPPARLAALPGPPGSLAAPRGPAGRARVSRPRGTPCNSTRSPGPALRPPRTASGAKVQPPAHHLRLRPEAGGGPGPRAPSPGRACGPRPGPEAGPSRASPRRAPSRPPHLHRRVRSRRLCGPGAARAAPMPVRRDGKRQEPNPAESARAAPAARPALVPPVPARAEAVPPRYAITCASEAALRLPRPGDVLSSEPTCRGESLRQPTGVPGLWLRA